jgi:hypothetical protein
MNKQELEARYKQAEILYIMKEFEDAVEILDQILEYAPGNREVLVAKAKSLAALDMREEAEKICEHLISIYNDSHAVHLLARLKTKDTVSHIL